MAERIERDIQIKAQRCNALLADALREFREYLGAELPPNAPGYYRARNMLREGKAFYEETVKAAKKMLGPIPAYASPEFEAWRSQALEDLKLMIHGQTVEELKNELAADELLASVMPAEEIAAYVDAHFETQRTGQRRLRNFKGRMLLDRLVGLLREAERLHREALRKQQGQA